MKKIFYTSKIVLIVSAVLLGSLGFGASVYASSVTGNDLISMPYSAEWTCFLYGSGYAGTDASYPTNIDCATQFSNSCPVAPVANNYQYFSASNTSCPQYYYGTVLYYQDLDVNRNCVMTPKTALADNCRLSPATVTVYPGNCPAGTAWSSNNGYTSTPFTFTPSSTDGDNISVYVTSAPSGWTGGATTPLSLKIYPGD